MRKSSTTRLFLNVFVASIVVNAALGIFALLSGDFGETEGKVLGTSFLASAAMLAVLVNIPALRRRALWPTPLVAAFAGASAFVLFIVLLWAEADDDVWFRIAGSLLVVAAAATLASSLALVDTSPSVQWLRPVGNGLIALLAITILYGIWFDPGASWYARVVGVEGVLVAALTLLIPVLSRFLSPGRPELRPDHTRPPAVRFCPSCGRPIDGGEATFGEPTVCGGCGFTFEVAVPVSPDAGVDSTLR